MDPTLNEVMIGIKVGGKCGLCYTNFLLAPLQEVSTKASPRSGQ